MTVELMAAWLLSIMMATSTPGQSRSPVEARETAAAGELRYRAIAGALATVTLDPAEQPVFEGARARERTALLMLAVSYYESSWRRDVDLGLGPRAHGSGAYHCLMQIGVGDGESMEGWTGAELTADRQKCFRAALHILQRGVRVCRGSDDETAFLNHYASGYCDRGREPVRERVRLYRHWWAERPPPDPPPPTPPPTPPRRPPPPPRTSPPKPAKPRATERSG